MNTVAIPAFVNAHSHAFQIGLRHTPQSYTGGTGTFWSWRDTMYDVVESLTPDRCYDLSRATFDTMMRVGIRTLGEFHYVHHGTDRDWTLDDAVLNAANDAGIRLVLLQTYYTRGGFDQSLEPAQQRFDGVDTTTFLKQMEMLAGKLQSGQSLGIACHSVRAVSVDDLQSLAGEAKRANWVLHMHLEEQRQEIEACRNVHGVGPVRLVLDSIDVDNRFTAVHCTHTTEEDLRDLLSTGAHICLCPLTEGNLADGVADLPSMMKYGPKQICLGTDSNFRIDMFEEMRFLELAQRLARERCGIAIDDSGVPAQALLHMATAAGASSLGIEDDSEITIDVLLPDDGNEPSIDDVVFGQGAESIR